MCRGRLLAQSGATLARDPRALESVPAPQRRAAVPRARRFCVGLLLTVERSAGVRDRAVGADVTLGRLTRGAFTFGGRRTKFCRLLPPGAVRS
jgi:hypothetical protein